MQGIGDLPGGGFSSNALATSFDGSVVVGLSISELAFSAGEAFRWTESTGMIGLGDFPGGDARSRAQLFSVICAELEQLDLSVHDARIYSANDGMSLDTFFVLDSSGAPIAEDGQRLRHIKEHLTAVLSSAPDAPNEVVVVIPESRDPKGALRHLALQDKTTEAHTTMNQDLSNVNGPRPPSRWPVRP